MARSLRGIIRSATDVAVYLLQGGVAAARRAGVTVGKDCRIYTRSFGSEPFLISMGDNVTITSGVKLITHDGSTGLVFHESGARYQRYAPVAIGDNVFIGVNAVVLPGITIGSNVVIGAGSIVTADIESNSVVAGNPARRLGNFEDFHARIESTCPHNGELAAAVGYRERVELAMAIAGGKSASNRGETNER